MTLPATGERFLPEIKGQIELEHLHRYAMARELVRGKIVLDIACGEGYGSALLSMVASSVVGVDISEDAIQHAQETYSNGNLRFLSGSCSNIPVEDGTIDVVVSFETIEHHSEHEEMMAEIKRVLRPKGVLIISSPDRYEYSVVPGYTNPYHVKELTREEFESLIGSHFKQHVMLGQRVVYGSSIFVESGTSAISSYGGTGSDIASTNGLARPTYLIAVASDGKIPKITSGLFEHPSHSAALVESLSKEIGALQTRVRDLAVPATRIDLYLSDHLGPKNFVDSRRLFHRLELSGEIETIHFDLPSMAAPIGGVRLDPSERSCALELSGILLRDALGNLIWEPDHPANAFSELSGDVMVVRKHGAGAIIFAFGDDPNMQINIPASAFAAIAGGGGTLELLISGRSIDQKALVEIYEQRVLLSNPASSHALFEGAVGQISTSLGLKLETISSEQRSLIQESSTVREENLLAQIKSLALQSESLQRDQLAALQDSSSIRETKLLEQIKLITLQSESLQNDLREVQSQSGVAQKREQVQLDTLSAEHKRELNVYREQLSRFEGLYAQAQKAENTLLEQNSLLTTRSENERLQLLAQLDILRGESDQQKKILRADLDQAHATLSRMLDREKMLLEQIKVLTLQTELIQGDLRDSRAALMAEKSNLNKQHASATAAILSERDSMLAVSHAQFVAQNNKLQEQHAATEAAFLIERDSLLTTAIEREAGDLQVIEVAQKRLASISNWKGFRLLAWLNGRDHNAHFIESAYIATLGRIPDSDGMSHYLTRLRAGCSKQDILDELRESDEGRSQRRKGREGYIDKLNYWSGRNDSTHALLSGSDESFIENAYMATLGRAPDAEGLQSYLAELQNGVPRLEILAALEQSDEGKSKTASNPLSNDFDDGQQEDYRSPRNLYIDPDSDAIYDLIEEREKNSEYINLIICSGLFDRQFYISKYSIDAIFQVEPELHFILFGEAKDWQPNPSFSPAVYLSLHSDVSEAGRKPFFHYVLMGIKELRAIKPPDVGLSYTPIPSLRGRSFSKPKRVAICAHIYYAELWDEFAQTISRLTMPFDLFVVIVDRGAPLDLIRNEIEKDFPKAQVLVFPNHGRDIFPFVYMAGSGLFDGYDLVGKIHTKKSPHRGDGDVWRKHLISGVLPETWTDELVHTLLDSDDVGLCVADGQIYEGSQWWGSNKKRVPELLHRIEIRTSMERLCFPAGSIYWVTKPIVNLVRGMQLTADDFESENSQLDGTTAHAFERTLGFITDAAKLKVVQSSELLHRKPNSNVHTREDKKSPFISCFYLPQFHPIPENDLWWGAGYTEWIGVAKSKPQFEKHNQPVTPEGTGFYDLRMPDVIGQQFKLAKTYGVDAFCVYYYSFDNKKRLLESPLDNLLERKDVEICFYLCWANESWTRNWDGMSGEILQAQTYLPGVELDIAQDCVKYFSDPRYYRYNGTEPRFVIYRPDDIPDLSNFVSKLRKAWLKLGFRKVNLGAVIFYTNANVSESTAALFDFFVEMPPHGLVKESDWIFNKGSSSHDPYFPANSNFNGLIYSYENLIENSINRVFPDYLKDKVVRGAMPSWDNTARRSNVAHIAYGSNPARFGYWVKNLARVNGNYQELMINAWNEWGEKAMLEPSTQYGKGYLDALKHALDK